MFDIPASPEMTREIQLTACVEQGWNLLAYQMGQLKGKPGEGIRREISLYTPRLKRPISSWKQKIDSAAKYLQDENPGLSNTEARVAVMTQNGRYMQILHALGESGAVPQGYLRTMEGLWAALPWNRTGSNPVTLKQLTSEDVAQALTFIQSKLPTEKQPQQ